MLRYAAIESHRAYAVYLNHRRIGSAWQVRKQHWRYKALDGLVTFPGRSLPAIKRELERIVSEDRAAPRTARGVPNLMLCW